MPSSAPRSLLRWLLAAALLLVALPSRAGAAVEGSATIVINEFRVHGAAGGTDEFVELYNRSAAPVAIGGWRLNNSTAAGTRSTRAVIPPGVSLGPGCYYLLVNSRGYTGGIAGDQGYTGGIAGRGGLALLDAAGAIVDQVGLSVGSAYQEGSALPPMDGALNQSYTRVGGSDSDHNSFDFSYSTIPLPQNGDSFCAPSPVTFASFTALPGGGSVAVLWESLAELEARGFNLYRDGGSTPLNGTLIPAFWGPSGGIYEWKDDSGAPDPTTHYWLEVVTTSGRVERIGPVPFYGGMIPTAVTVGDVRAGATRGAHAALLLLAGALATAGAVAARRP